MTGDARGDLLVEELEATGLMPIGGVIDVDVYKLPHHGSQSNNFRSTFERIRAKHYVICADGIRHEHPSPGTLRALVESRPEDHEFTVHLTNPIATAQALLADLAKGRAFTVNVGAPHVEIRLAE